MLNIEEKNISITRGNMLPIDVSIRNDDGSLYEFQTTDILRFKVFDKRDVNIVYLQKDFTIDEPCTMKQIIITANEMKLGKLTNKDQTFWYEIELNPDTDYTQTIVGCTQENPAILTITPEGGDIEGGSAND